MMKIFSQKILFPLFFILFFFSRSWLSASDTPIMPLSEIHPGMRGICKTVFRGDSIEEIEVEGETGGAVWFDLKILDGFEGTYTITATDKDGNLSNEIEILSELFVVKSTI